MSDESSKEQQNHGGKLPQLQHTLMERNMSEELIGGGALGNVTYGFVVGHLVENWPEFSEMAQKSTIKSVNSEKVSLVRTNIWRCIFTFSTNQALSVVVKVMETHFGTQKIADLPEPMAKMAMELFTKAHNREADFYRIYGGGGQQQRVTKLLNSNSANIPPLGGGLPMPAIYYIGKYATTTVAAANDCEDEEKLGGISRRSRVHLPDDSIPPMLIMEDLQMIAYDHSELNEEQGKSIVVHLANFHGQQLIPWMHSSKGGSDCDHHHQRDNAAFERKQFYESQQLWAQFEQMCSVEGSGAAPVVVGDAHCGDQLDKFVQLAKQLWQALDNHSDFLDQAHENFLLDVPEVLVHGDLHPGNLMFSRADPSQVHAFIDFQMVFIGTIAYELERALFLGTINSVWADSSSNNDVVASSRQQMEHNLLTLYYETLKARLMVREEEDQQQQQQLGHISVTTTTIPGFTIDQLRVACSFCRVIAAVRALSCVIALLKNGLTTEVKEMKGQLMAAETLVLEALEIIMKDGEKRDKNALKQTSAPAVILY